MHRLGSDYATAYADDHAYTITGLFGLIGIRLGFYLQARLGS